MYFNLPDDGLQFKPKHAAKLLFILHQTKQVVFDTPFYLPLTVHTEWVVSSQARARLLLPDGSKNIKQLS